MTSEERELAVKLRAFMIAKRGAYTQENIRAMFDEYDRDHDGRISKSELDALLKDAGIGNVVTRPFWILGVLAKLDTNQDRQVDWLEFSSALAVLEAQLPPL